MQIHWHDPSKATLQEWQKTTSTVTCPEKSTAFGSPHKRATFIHSLATLALTFLLPKDGAHRWTPEMPVGGGICKAIVAIEPQRRAGALEPVGAETRQAQQPSRDSTAGLLSTQRDWQAGYFWPYLILAGGFGFSLGCFGFFFSLPRSLFPINPPWSSGCLSNRDLRFMQDCHSLDCIVRDSKSAARYKPVCAEAEYFVGRLQIPDLDAKLKRRSTDRRCSQKGSNQ